MTSGYTAVCLVNQRKLMVLTMPNKAGRNGDQAKFLDVRDGI